MRRKLHAALTGAVVLLAAAPSDAGTVTLEFGPAPGSFTDLSVTPADNDAYYDLEGVWSEAGYELAFNGFLSEDEGAAARGDAIGNGFAYLDDCGGGCFAGNSSLDAMTLTRSDGRPFKLESVTASTRSSYYFGLELVPEGQEMAGSAELDIYVEENPYYYPQLGIGGQPVMLMEGTPVFADFNAWIWPTELYDLAPPIAGSSLDFVPLYPSYLSETEEIDFLAMSIQRTLGDTPLVASVIDLILANPTCSGGSGRPTNGNARDVYRECSLTEPGFGTVNFTIYEGGGRNDTLGFVFDAMTVQEIPLPGGAALLGGGFGALAALAALGAARRRNPARG